MPDTSGFHTKLPSVAVPEPPYTPSLRSALQVTISAFWAV